MGPENLKKSRPKKLVKSNKSISSNYFLTKFHFLQFLKYIAKNQFLNWENFKTVRNAISRKKLMIYLICRVFLPGLF